MSGTKRQSSLLSFGFGQESGSSPPEKRSAVDSECTEAGSDISMESQSGQTEPTGSLISTVSRTSGESQTSAEPSMSPVSSFEDLSPPYDIGEVYDMAKNLIMKGKATTICIISYHDNLYTLTDMK